MKEDVIYLGSYRWDYDVFPQKGSVIIHITARSAGDIPVVDVQGEDIHNSKINETAKDILLELKRQFPKVNFTVKTFSQAEYI